MKVLLDENLPHSLREHLLQYETFTAAYMGWAGLKNGELLDVAEAFDVLVTGDRSLQDKQNLSGWKIALVSSRVDVGKYGRPKGWRRKEVA